MKWDLFVTTGIPTVTKNPPPGEKQRFFSPISSTLIYGKRDAVLVDTFMTANQNDVLVDWVKGSGKNLTTIYITHGPTAITGSGLARSSSVFRAREPSHRRPSSR